jgi:hypothetical protein
MIELEAQSRYTLEVGIREGAYVLPDDSFIQMKEFQWWLYVSLPSNFWTRVTIKLRKQLKEKRRWKNL